MKKKALLLLTLCTLFFACDKKQTAMERIGIQFKNSLKTVTGNDEIKTPVYVVIPRAGCDGCISTAESYMINSLKDSTKNDKTFILTDFDSDKLLKARFGSLMQNKYVIKDTENIFKANKSLKSIYPTVFMFDKSNGLAAVSEVSPAKDGLGEITMFLQASM